MYWELPGIVEAWRFSREGNGKEKGGKNTRRKARDSGAEAGENRRQTAATAGRLVVVCGLRVIALTGARGQAGPRDFYFEVVIFVGAFGWGRGEGDLVIGRDVGKALLQHRGEIVIELESETTALNGEHLESQVAQIDLAGFADTFQELLVVGAAKDRLAGANRIDVVESDARLPELSGETYNLREDVCLLLGVELDIGAGKERPAGRNPDQDFAPRTRSLGGSKLIQPLEGILQAFGCAVEAGGASDVAETNLIAIHRGA